MSDSQRRRVLVADDVRVNAMIAATILQQKGFEVKIAQDGEQCLDMVQSAKPDLIVLDLMMPKVHGLEVLKRVKSNSETRDIGVIICTAKDYKTEADQARELGAYGYLVKPLNGEDLLALVERFFTTGTSEAQREASVQTEGAVQGEVFCPALRADHGTFRFWGTRGSTPVSGTPFVRHGGNTSCMDVEYGGERVIFDAGSGIRDLGLALLREGPRKLHLFITHTHWDHIQGFPFFTPAYVPGFDITIYASPNVDKDLESIFKGQLDRAYFPVQLEDMQANLTFTDLGDQPTEIGDIKVSWEYTYHPSAAVGYKVEIGGRTLAYVTDNEFLRGYLEAPDTITLEDDRVAVHQELIGFLKDVDILVHEAQYANEEYTKKIGWGHTCLSNACALVKLTGPKRWVVTHHDPEHDDTSLQEKLSLTRQLLHDLGVSAEVSHAYDGMVEYL